MAKKFGGFTPQQQHTLLSKMGYTGPAQQDDLNKFMMASPKAASMMGKYAGMAKARVEGGPQVAMQVGGTVEEPVVSLPEPLQPTSGQERITDDMRDSRPARTEDRVLTTTNGTTKQNLTAAKEALATQKAAMNDLAKKLAGMDADDPERETLEESINEQKVKLTQANADYDLATKNYALLEKPTATEVLTGLTKDPEASVTKQVVATTSEDQRKRGLADKAEGQTKADVAKVEQTEATIAKDVALAEEFKTAGMTAKQAAEEVTKVLDALTAATGKPSDEALAEAATMSTEDLAQLGLTAEQIDRARRVESVDPLKVTEDMLVEGSAVDFDRVKAETNFAAATGVPSSEATVQGQLTGLLEQFEGGETPAWAAGAMRTATATLAARGLGASSMAGQAIIQAAMESALPIAQADASTRAQFEAQNLSNKQQAAMFAAQQRASFLNLEFTQEFQAQVSNAAAISDVAKINFTAEQQVALENARMAQTVDIANLDAKNAKILADAAAMSNLDMANLSNEQQANVQRAAAFLQIDMANLSNEQQAAVIKAEGKAKVLTSDAAQENLARQTNATNENQVKMFFSQLQADIATHNNEQANSLAKFNAGEANIISKHNADAINRREEFNTTNALVIEQANALWEQTITTADNAAINAANRDAAAAANGLTETAYNSIIQMERDTLDYIWRSYESNEERANALILAQIGERARASEAKGQAWGSIAGIITKGIVDSW
jgi:hypothetical protein